MLENVPPWLIPLYKFVTRFFPKWKDSWVLVARKKSRLVTTFNTRKLKSNFLKLGLGIYKY